MLTITRRSLGLGGAAALLAGPALGQRLSERPLTIIVPFTAGSGPDLLARLASDELRNRWGQTVVIDNKPGASGNIGAAAASKSTPDGHTLLLYVNTVLLNAAMSRKLPFDPIKDFTPIIEIARGALALAVHKSVDVTDANALVAMAKAKPDDLTYASPGRATPHHLAMELFKLRTGSKLRHVPFTGTAGAVQAVVGGHVQAMFIPIHVGLSHAQDGNIRILGVGSNKRSPQAPNVPTLAEQGIANTDVDLWYGLSAPAGTPVDIIERLNKALNEALADPKVRATLDKQGLAAVGGTTQSFANLIAKDLPLWRDVVQSAGLAVDE
jgi:tripartite-type tricarboxylate transporter receptor subunit TctC